MVNVIIVLVLIVLIGIAVVRIVRTIRYGGSCCGGSGGLDKKIRVKDRNKTHYPFLYKLKVEGMVCAGCARKVENAINSDGDMWASVDLETKEVRVFAKRKMDRNGFLALLKGTPYILMDVKDAIPGYRRM